MKAIRVDSGIPGMLKQVKSYTMKSMMPSEKNNG